MEELGVRGEEGEGEGGGGYKEKNRLNYQPGQSRLTLMRVMSRL